MGVVKAEFFSSAARTGGVSQGKDDKPADKVEDKVQDKVKPAKSAGVPPRWSLRDCIPASGC